MIYHTWSLVGLMLWLRYGLARGRPFTPLAEIYAKYLERPDTKAYSCDEAASLFANASNIVTHVELTHGDLLDSGAGQRHVGGLLTFARLIWPRWLLRRLAKQYGLFLLISGTRPLQ